MDDIATDTALVSYADSNDASLDDFDWLAGMALDRCPRVGRRERIVPSTGELVPDYCRALFCPYCSKVRARLTQRAMAAAEPSHLLTLTRAGCSWSEVREHMKRLLGALNRRGRIAMAWSVEEDTSARHVHAVVHGHVPRPEVLSEYAQRVGMGRRTEAKQVAKPRAASGYLLKGVRSNLPTHLDLNGGRLVHATRDYWRVDGQQVAGMHAAIHQTRNQGGTR